MRLPHRQERILVVTARDQGIERLPQRKLGTRHPNSVLGNHDEARSLAVLDDVGNGQGWRACRAPLASQERYSFRARADTNNVAGAIAGRFAAESPDLSVRQLDKTMQARPCGFPPNLVLGAFAEIEDLDAFAATRPQAVLAIEEEDGGARKIVASPFCLISNNHPFIKHGLVAKHQAAVPSLADPARPARNVGGFTHRQIGQVHANDAAACKTGKDTRPFDRTQAGHTPPENLLTTNLECAAVENYEIPGGGQRDNLATGDPSVDDGIAIVMVLDPQRDQLALRRWRRDANRFGLLSLVNRRRRWQKRESGADNKESCEEKEEPAPNPSPRLRGWVCGSISHACSNKNTRGTAWLPCEHSLPLG